MKTVEELREEHAAAVAKLEMELDISAACPVQPSSVYRHRRHASVTYRGKEPGQRLCLARAAEVYRAWAPIVEPAEHWKCGCLSIQPKEINEYASEPAAVMDGESWAELVVSSFGDRGNYYAQELRFWSKANGTFLHVEMQLEVVTCWLPSRVVSFNHQGELARCEITPRFLGESERIKWGSTPPGYRFSYFWADKISFESWLDRVLENPANA